MLNRRQFIKKSLVGGAGLWLPVGYGTFLLNKAVAAPTIVNSTANTSEQHISISNGAVARLLPTFSWNSIRVGIRYIFNGSSSLSGTPHFYLGLCHGTTNILGDATCDNFLGAGTASTTWTAFANSGGNMGNLQISGGTANLLVAKKVNTTITTGSAVSSTIYFPIGPINSAWQRFHFVDITRGSPNWSVTLTYSNNFSNSVVPTNADFVAQMRIVGTLPSFSNHTSGSTVTLAFDETAGALDAINVWWDQTSDTLEISDLAVTKLA